MISISFPLLRPVYSKSDISVFSSFLESQDTGSLPHPPSSRGVIPGVIFWRRLSPLGVSRSRDRPPEADCPKEGLEMSKMLTFQSEREYDDRKRARALCIDEVKQDPP
jgi:hypothetical protein